MVKPQPKLRKSAEEDDGDNNDAANQSFDSYHVASTKDCREPDFIVVMAAGNPDTPDKPLLCVEVKRQLANYDSESAVTEQFKDYLRDIAKKDPHREFRGILLGGDRFFTAHYTWDKEGNIKGVRMDNTNEGEGRKPTEGLLTFLEKCNKAFQA